MVSVHPNSNSDTEELAMEYLEPKKLELRAIESETELARDLSVHHPDVTRRELWGWWMFEWASQPFSSAAVTIFIPLILEDIAWRAGSINPQASDYPPCPDRSTLSVEELSAVQCYVPFAFGYVNPVSFSLYTTAISVGLQVFSFISFGAFADYSRYRKLLMIIFSCISSFTCIGFLGVVSPKLFWLASVLMIISNVCFGSAMVFYNAYLPLLVDATPSVRQLKAKIESQLYEVERENERTMFASEFDNDHSVSSEEHLNRKSQLQSEAAQELHDLRDKVSNQISTHGFATSYTSAVVSLLLLGGLLFAFGSNSIYMMQICVAIVGGWWLLFMFAFVVPWLKQRPGPPFPKDEHSFFLFSWKKTIKTVTRCTSLKNTFFFLISWFFYADAYSTIASVAILYGKSTLNMSNVQLMYIAIGTPFVAVIGNYLFLFLFYRTLKIKSRNIIVLIICLMCLIPIYGALGLVIPESVPLGLRTLTEIYVISGYYGLLLGALQSFSRVVFSELIPPGMEGEFFALYEITDRGSSWLGPVLVALMTDYYGIRYGFFIILGLFLISLPGLLAIDMVAGKHAARHFSVNNNSKKSDKNVESGSE